MKSVVLIAVSLALLAGCGLLKAPAPPPAAAKPTRVELLFVGADNLNPSASKRPSPLVLRVYELRSMSGFNGADFMALYSGTTQTLGPDVLSREDVTLQPGETRAHGKATLPETRFIGVVALYRDIEHAIWRAAVPLRPNQSNALTVRADALVVTIHAVP